MSLRTQLQDHPGLLVWSWKITEKLLLAQRGLFERLGLERSSRLVHWFEKPLKRVLFDCRMCGQCILHYTGMTCPMTCPKQLRNGPCGGVCMDGKCEVIPGLDCVWAKAVERSAKTPWDHELMRLNPPVDWRLENLASWVTFATGRDQTTIGGKEGSIYAKDGRQ